MAVQWQTSPSALQVHGRITWLVAVQRQVVQQLHAVDGYNRQLCTHVEKHGGAEQLV